MALDRAPDLRLKHWATGRLPYLDNLKVVLIAGVIALHAVLGYSSIEVWTYTELREVTLAPVTEVVLIVLVSPFGFFLMALLFLVAGLLTPASYDRKGGARFVRDRVLRLGVPFVIYVFLVQPTLDYLLHHWLGDATGSYWEEYLGTGRLDTGPLWFVGVLLIFSLGYAGVRAASSTRRRSSVLGSRVSIPMLVAAAVVVAPVSFLVRLAYPYGSESGVADLNFWEWPACLALFALGAGAARHGWLTAVPVRLARQCRKLTMAGTLAMAALVLAVVMLDRIDDAAGGASWPAAAFAVVDAVLTVFGSIWLLSVAQRRLRATFRWGPALSRSAYAAFMVQSVFLLGIAVALRPLGLPAEVKASTVAVGAVVASFGAAWLLITRMRGIGRIL